MSDADTLVSSPRCGDGGAGGIAAASMIAAPMWFMVLDLEAAYIPTAWIGAMLGRRLKEAAVARA